MEKIPPPANVRIRSCDLITHLPGSTNKAKKTQN